MHFNKLVIEFLLKQGFRPTTLMLLNDENLLRLADEYGWKPPAYEYKKVR